MPKMLVFGVHDQLGGVETYCKNMVMNVADWDFDFVSTFPTMCFEDFFMNRGSRIFKVSDFHKHPFAYYNDVDNLFRENAYDAIYYNMLSSANVVPLSIAKKHRIKHIIAHAHNAGTPDSAIKGTLNRFQRKRTTRLATDLFSCSDKASDWMFGTRNDVTVIPNSVDTDVFNFDPQKRKAERNRLQIEDNTLVVGTVGRFTKQKNQSFLIDIFKAFHSSVPNSLLILVGGGELKMDLESKVRSLHLEDSVLFENPRSDIYNAYNSFDIFALTSLFEGLPIALIEAQACGLPFLSADTISTEAKITNAGTYLPLTVSAEVWAKELLRATESSDRESVSHQVAQSKWSLSYQADFLNMLFGQMR
ncbi:glycosyltransferase [Bifidobacterium tibiigranuli]|jgi:glycosyltransferase involved in cell wall biosynthesis|uniref:glycosyltransferase n=1 Tax=Bifidobacterium tibiigranuli TaxID=2172043 RepID=UPI002356149C|nr:glycosyltransferase [Bifidobacterium tibiigranuli]MCI1210899.1 glycosyltransferase [Bifidobacterium tibiigranuli]MCI1220534.1 glycosyltransferase [Bifidobacterium tibiigranuli]